MMLTPYNSTNPLFWGKELKFVLDGKVVGDKPTKVEIPTEFDFLNAFYPNNPQAREYFKWTMN